MQPNDETFIKTAPVPAGNFVMGDAHGREDEQSVHSVYVSTFLAAVVPITNQQYARFLDEMGHERPRFFADTGFNQPEQPVVGVSWFDATAFCDWLSFSTGSRWRLPTEAEREKAARGGIEGARFPWGDDPGPDGGRFVQPAPRPAGQSAPNGYGLFDTAYNVHEWCSDWYEAGYYAIAPGANPQGPPSGTRRASRGGAWRHQIKISRCAARSSLNPSFRYNDYGFRVVMDMP